MPQLELKPTHKIAASLVERVSPLRAAIQRWPYAMTGIKHETAVRSAFHSLSASNGAKARVRCRNLPPRRILNELLENYAEHGDARFGLPEVLRVPPISDHGQLSDIINIFGGAEQLPDAVNQLQPLPNAAQKP